MLLEHFAVCTCRKQQASGRLGCRAAVSHVPPPASDSRLNGAPPGAPDRPTPILVMPITKEMRMPKYLGCHSVVHPVVGRSNGCRAVAWRPPLLIKGELR